MTLFLHRSDEQQPWHIKDKYAYVFREEKVDYTYHFSGEERYKIQIYIFLNDSTDKSL